MVCTGNDYTRAKMPGTYPASMGGTPEVVTPSNGLFYHGSCYNIGAVTDGTSNTIAMSESPVGPGGTSISTTYADAVSSNLTRNHLAQNAAGTVDTVTDYLTLQSDLEAKTSISFVTTRGSAWILTTPNFTAFNAFIPPNSKIPSADNMNQGFYAVKSYHSGGVNLLLADGSVRFISETINYETWKAAATIGGAEIQTGF
jgi:prepilin-type processing-associated H-X9-DG protein